MTLLTLLSITIFCVNITIADVITFEKSGLPTAKHDTEKHAGVDEESQHLPLSSLFSQSDRYKCMIEGKRELCSEDDVIYMKDKFGADVTPEQSGATQSPNVKTKAEMQHKSEEGIIDGLGIDDDDASRISGRNHVAIGPRYQPIHLHLPRKPMYRVSFKIVCSDL